MKIIFASKYYYRRGGLESYLFKAKELLESYGHQVIPFSTNYFQNYETEYSRYFTKYYDLSEKGHSEILNNINATVNMFFNREAYNRMINLIKETKPDLVQGFGVTKHLTYSIFKAAKDMGVPTIMRLSDYAILCPNSTAVDASGEICSDFSCSTRDFSRILKNKCIHDSLIASIIGKCEVKVNLLLNVYKKYVDYFIAPSRFIRNIFIERFGISPQRIVYLPIFIDSKSEILSESDNEFYLFAGRLSREKGIYTLLNAFEKNKKNKLVIAGTGPKEGDLKKYVQEKGINAQFVGFKDYESLQHLIKKSNAVIIPSEWYENSPNIVLEAYVQGKPVIGARIGGITELIEDNKTGLLFEAGNADDLAEKINLINTDSNLVFDMSRNAKAMIKDKYASDDHYEQLMNIYKFATRKKVLLVNNFYYNRGGDCTYLFGLKNILEKKGHNVIVFSMHHPQNIDSLWSKYFVNYINYDEEVKRISFKSVIKVATRTIFFLKAKRMIDILIREEKPDIAHLQNIHHHITPSILYSLKKNKIPVIWTLHDYQLICPNISFLAHGTICERCKKKKYYWPPIVKCKKGSFAASLMSSFEIIIHNIMDIDRLINVYIAPSQFLKDKFIEFGFEKEKISQISHFIDNDFQIETIKTDDYYLFIGRISEEKGIKTLIDAAVNVNLSKLKIVGGGPLFEEKKMYATTIDENKIIEFLGHRNREEVYDILQRCKFLVVPSEWYEPSGLVILEAFTCGKPVIAARAGGIPEMIEDNKTGLMFEMGNAEDLSSKIEYMLNSPEEVKRMGENARKFAEQELSPDNYYKKIIEIYNKVSS
jgi:glycosyltransferase involved in cell wall biosynthesis